MKNFDSRTYSINDFLEWWNTDQLVLNPHFQRKQVWTDNAKSYLMDTIVRGKPIPKLFIRQQLNTQTRKSVREVVDGQQHVPAKVAFARIRDCLAEVSYNYGDKWHVVTADTQSGRITANLRFTDEFTHIEGDARGNIHTRKERLQRFLAVNIQVLATSSGTAIIQLDFSPKVEGVGYTACDSIVTALTNTIDSALRSRDLQCFG